MGVLIKPGQRQVLYRYEPGMWKAWTALAGFSIWLLLAAIEALLTRMWSGPPAGNARYPAGMSSSPPQRHAGSKAVVAG